MPAVPVVAAFAATSAGFTIAGSAVLGAAVVGAVAGGIVAAVQGEDILEGAVMGGISGAVVGMAAGAGTAASGSGGSAASGTMGMGSDAASLASAESSVAGATGTAPTIHGGAVASGNAAPVAKGTVNGVTQTTSSASSPALAGGKEVAGQTVAEQTVANSASLGTVGTEAPTVAAEKGFLAGLDSGDKLMFASMTMQGVGSVLAAGADDEAAELAKKKYNASQLTSANVGTGATGVELTDATAIQPNSIAKNNGLLLEQPEISNATYNGGLLNAASKYRTA